MVLLLFLSPFEALSSGAVMTPEIPFVSIPPAVSGPVPKRCRPRFCATVATDTLHYHASNDVDTIHDRLAAVKRFSLMISETCLDFYGYYSFY
jgi:hypothetical protein